ncbi:thiamine-phosphate kinase [Leucobacter denitrificans]|uniref:Thiamine-monophosphate kinase n=1 Tax=Leucobacter denitrificans TaxID=683042 RepID=A0A7G9S7J3_9MICO|nr:thiamine-phosphate kinase [Leucobacter denitrificans]
MLKRVLEQLRPAEAASLGPGDDCAVLTSTGDLVVTSDTMIEGPDFRLAWHSGYELGWKLAATNLSDVASMGARATALTVSFACPSDTPVELLAEVSRGLDAACAELAPGCGVIGGDLSRAPMLFAAVTAMGDLEGRAPVTRSAARAGDVVAYAGDLGLAGLGLSLLFANCADANGEAQSAGLAELRSQHGAALSAQFAPSPPIHLGVAASEAGATAMMDVSDGLALDANRMARASNVTLELSSSEIIRSFGAQRGVKVPLEAILEGGEDHGLLACFPKDIELPTGFHPIGAVRERQDAPVQVDGKSYAPRGWDPYTEYTPGLTTSKERA